MRRYRGFIVDSERWERFAFRSDDVVISTPSSSGTTWMQTIVGMLILDRIDLGAPISTLSPWLDMLTYTDEEMFRLLEEQRHRRFIKTHTPLDGVPRLPSVTYMTVIRHPLDTALSYRDHEENLDSARLVALRATAAGPDESEDGSFGDAVNGRESERHPEDEPEAPDAYLRWFIDNDREPNGSGPYGLADYCNQIRTYWDARESRTCICSTTPICGTSGTARCGRWLPRSASRSLRSGGQPSSRRPD